MSKSSWRGVLAARKGDGTGKMLLMAGQNHQLFAITTTRLAPRDCRSWDIHWWLVLVTDVISHYGPVVVLTDDLIIDCENSLNSTRLTQLSVLRSSLSTRYTCPSKS